MDKFIVGIGGASLSLFVIWYFLFKPSKKGEASMAGKVQEIEILVEGGYKPDIVELKKGVPVKLKFDRKDESSCLEEVVISAFNIRKKLKLGEITSVEFMPDKEGEFDFSCGMGMFHGKIIVK